MMRFYQGSACTLLSWVMATLLVACSIQGDTSRMTLELEPVANSSLMRQVAVASVEREEGGIRAMSSDDPMIRAIIPDIGIFNSQDQANLHDSLVDTLHQAQKGYSLSQAEPIRIHLLVRRHYVASSNNAGVIFAGVEWVAVDQQQQILFKDAFYATSVCDNRNKVLPSICTLGWEKDKVHAAIIKRVATIAMTLAAGGQPSKTTTPGTYLDYEAAAASAPKFLQSTGGFGIVVQSAGVELDSWAKMEPPIDWPLRLRSTP